MKNQTVEIRSLFGALVIAAVSTPAAWAQTNWDGGGADNNWTTAANWQSDLLPANDGTANIGFGGTVRPAPWIDTPQNVLRVGFEAGASSFNLGGGTLTLQSTGTSVTTAAISNRSSVLQTISASIGMGTGGGNSYIFTDSGDLALIGNVSIGSRKIVVGGADDLSISGNVSGAGSVGAAILLNIGFGGTMTLSGSNSYTGSNEIRDGILRVKSGNALGAGSADVQIGSSTGTPSLLIGGAFTVAHNVLVTGATANPITLGGDTAHTSVFSGTVKLGSTAGKAVTVSAAEGGTVRFEGNLVTSASGVDDLDAVTKSGQGTVILAGAANTYSGSTAVTEGTLLVNGGYSAPGQGISVASGAAFGGRGTVNRSVTIAGGATLIGGDGTATLGALTLGGGLALGDASVIGLALGAGGTHSSLVRTGGTWVFDADQAFSIDGGLSGDYMGIVTGLTGSEAGLGTIASWTITNPLYAGSTFSFDGNDVNLHLVPEPSTWALAGLGLGLAFFRRLKRLRASVL